MQLLPGSLFQEPLFVVIAKKLGYPYTTQSRLLATLQRKSFENIVVGGNTGKPALSPFPTIF